MIINCQHLLPNKLYRVALSRLYKLFCMYKSAAWAPSRCLFRMSEAMRLKKLISSIMIPKDLMHDKKSRTGEGMNSF